MSIFLDFSQFTDECAYNFWFLKLNAFRSNLVLEILFTELLEL